MSDTSIRDEVLGLPAGERARLIDALWDSLSSPESKSREEAWAKESERRIDAFEAGTLKAREVKDALAEVRRHLSR